MNDQKTDATENGNKLETPASPETRPDTPKPSGATGKDFVPEEDTGSVPVVTITILDTPAEAPPDLDIDLIDVPILTQVVEPEDEQNQDPQASDQ